MAENVANTMAQLSLGGPGEQRSYIPPHMRSMKGGPPPAGPPPMNGAGPGLNGSAWAPPPQ